MGRCTDASGIMFRMLNASKGPAMHSPRAQADKKLYQATMKRWVEEQPNLTLRQELVERLLLESGRGKAEGANEPSSSFPPSAFPLPPSPRPPLRVVGVTARGDTRYLAPCVILTTGTFLK